MRLILHNIAHWVTLSGYGRNRILRNSYVWLFVVPMVGKLMSGVNEGAAILLGEENLKITLGLPFSWKAFFISAVCFSVASAIYYIRCPSFVRRFDGYSSFRNAGGGLRHLMNAGEHYGGEWLFDHAEFQHVTAGEGHLEDFFGSVMVAVDEIRPLSRLACQLLYLGGFGAIAVVLCQNVIFVFREVW